MTVQSFRKTLIIALVMMIASLFVLSVSADRLPGEVKIEGVLTSNQGGVITVAGESISVVGLTLPQTILVGSYVEVYAVPNGSTWTAREVDAHRVEGVNEGKITGEIEAINGSLVTIGGRVYDIAGTRILGLLEVGSVIEIDLIGATDAETGLPMWSIDEVALDDSSDDSATHDAGDDHGVDGAGHDAGDDHGVDSADHDAGDDHGVDSAGHDAGDDHGGDDSSDDGSDDHGGHGGSDDHGGHGGD